MTKSSIVYDDFSGGDWGIRKLTSVNKNQWIGENVQLFPDGSIGPRSAPVKLAPAGLPTTSTVRPSIHLARDGKVFFIVGATVYSIDTLTSSTLTTYTGSLTGGSSSSAAQIYTDLRLGRYWINRAGLGLDYVSGTAVTAVTTPAAFRMIAMKGDRMVGVAGRVIYFSAAGDYTSWPALNQIDLGEGSDIQFVHTSGDTLYVATESSTFAVQGTLGSTGTTVRQVAASGAPILRSPSASGGAKTMNQEPWRAAKLSDDTIAWLSMEDSANNVPNTMTGNQDNFGVCSVSFFKGGNTTQLTLPNYARASYASTSASYEVFHAAARDGLVLFPQGGRAISSGNFYALLVKPGGYVERHSFTPTTSFGGPGNDLNFIAGPQVAWDRSGVVDSNVVVWAQRNSSNAIEFWYWKTDPGQPLGGSGVTGNFTLAPFFPEPSEQVKVRGIDVYGVCYGTSGSDTSLAVKTDSRIVDGLGDIDSAGASYQDATQTITPHSLYVTAGAAPTRFVHRFRTGNSVWGAGATAALTIKGVAILKVVLHVETRDTPNV